MDKIKELLGKYKEVIMYLIFGVFTTLVNILGYAFLAKVLKINYMVSNITALVASIIFAYITNKIFVFESKKNTVKDVVKEILSFFSCRGVTALMDIVLMYVTVSKLHFNDMLMKIVVNVLVIVLNYVFSKMFVFKKEENKKNKFILEDGLSSMFKILFITFAGILGFFSFFITAYFKNNYKFRIDGTDVEKVFYKIDNILLNILGVLIVTGIIYVLVKILQKLKISNKIFVIGMLFIIFVIGTYLVYTLQITPRADSSVVVSVAQKSINNNFKAFEIGQYMDWYPYQVGIVFYIENLMRIFNIQNFTIVQFVNVIMLCVTFYFMYLTIEKMFKNDIAKKIAIITMFMFIPIYGYIFFTYGNIPGLCFGIISIYYMLKYLENKKISNIILSSVTIAIAINLKNNYLIFFIAEAIIYLINMLKTKDYKLIFVILLTFLFNKCMFKGIEKYYEIRGGIELSEGIPKNLWVAMGMHDNNMMAEGWFDGFQIITYTNANYDVELSKEIGNQEIKNRMKTFISNPKYMLKFYLKKTISQWCEPTYESIWITQPYVEENKPYIEKIERSRILNSLYAGKLNKIYERYCDYIGIFILLFATYGIYINFKSIKSENLIFAIIFLGGIAFHTLWEGKSQYIWTYLVCIIPYVGGVIKEKNNKLLKLTERK